FGWRGKRAAGVLYMGSAFLLLAYVGSRFVLEIILGRVV
ncbi:MAG: cytochrome C assembly protein, partial [Rhodoferax sp.]|nr:cytochrome C assembly protein [Rhodoferax sp.]